MASPTSSPPPIPDDAQVTPDEARYAARALVHLYHLTRAIGPRPSTRRGEREAAHYAARVLRGAGLGRVRVEPFDGVPSMYMPYGAAFAAGLLGSAVAMRSPSRTTAAVSAALNAAGAWAFVREAELQDHWGRRLSPHHPSQNVVAVIPAASGRAHRRAVCVAHTDTHRTPFVYGSKLGLGALRATLASGFAGLTLSALVDAWAALQGVPAPRGLAGLSAALKLAAVALNVYAETTPYTVGANDNASGLASLLALAERLGASPLPHTEVWIVATGCEESGTYGIAAFLDAYADLLDDSLFINIDTVGIGSPSILTDEGILRRLHVDAHLRDIARRVAAQRPELGITEHGGGSYSDTGTILRRGGRAVTVQATVPSDHPAWPRNGYWHQLRDQPHRIEPTTIARTHALVWSMLQSIDREAHIEAGLHR